MDVYVIDLETFYDKTYSLSKLTTEEYINDPRFELIGLSIKKNDCTAEWYSGDDPAGFLARFNFSGSMIVCHNTMFDAAILDWKYGVKPKVWADTMSMARFVRGVHESASLAALAKAYGLGEKGTEVINALGKRRQDFTPAELARYGDYCINDTELTYELFKQLVTSVPKAEIKLIDITLRMFIEPTLEVDQGILVHRHQEITQEKQAMLNSLKEKLNVDSTEEVRKILASNKKFAELLAQYGVDAPMKQSPSNPEKMIPALGKKDGGFIELQDHEDAFIRALCGIRLNTKSTMEQGRIENFIQIAKRNDNKLPIPLNYCGAHTSRWSGKDAVNLQNLPSRDPKKKALKNSITAPPGYVVINCDSSQIEARIVAWLAGQEDILDAFRNKEDVYRLMGGRIYNMKPEDITKEARFLAKTVVLGCGFGTGWMKLQAELNASGVKLPDEECKKIIRIYRESNYKIVELWGQAGECLEKMLFGRPYSFGIRDCMRFDADGITLPSGYTIRYPGLHIEEVDNKPKYFYKSRKGTEKIWFGTLVENCIGGGTEVLTDRGWVCIEGIKVSDKVHDGVEFVSHHGIVDKSVQGCIEIDGVYMTPDHGVLTDEGWVRAERCERPYRPEIWIANSFGSKKQRQVNFLETPMRLREHMREAWGGVAAKYKRRPGSKLRMSYRYASEKTENPRDDAPPGVLGMEVYAGSLPFTFTSSMEKLWGKGYKSMRAVGSIVYRILGGHGFFVYAGDGFGSDQQRRKLRAGELPVGDPKSKRYEPPLNSKRNGRFRSIQKIRDITFDALLPDKKRLAYRDNRNQTIVPKRVFDVINCGPRQRFVVRGDEGPFIVHNCVQGLARCVVGEQMLLISKRYRPALTVHDAAVVVVPEEEKDEAVAFTEDCMSFVPKWAEGLPVACESGVDFSYGGT